MTAQTNQPSTMSNAMSQPAKADPFADLGSLTGLKPKDNTPAPKQSMNAMQMGSQQPSNPPQAQNFDSLFG